MTRLMTILVTLLLASTATAAGLSVSIHKEVYVEGRLILIRDVAELTGDIELVNKAGAVSLGISPQTLAGATVSKGTLIKRLAMNGISEDKVEFRGEDQAIVYSATVWGVAAGVKDAGASAVIAKPTPAANAGATNAAPSGTANAGVRPDVVAPPAPVAVKSDKPFMEVVTTEIRSIVAKNLGLEAEDIHLSGITEGPALKVLAKDVAQFVSCSDNTGTFGGPLGRRAYLIDASVNGVRQQGLTLTLTIARLETVVVSTRRLNAGTLITTNDVRLEKRPFTTEATDYFTVIDDVVGMEPNRQAVNEGGEVRRSAVRAATLVRKGQNVEIKTLVGKHIVTAKGKALDDGVKNALIRIEREVPASTPNGKPEKVTVHVRVKGVNEVELDLAK